MTIPAAVAASIAFVAGVFVETLTPGVFVSLTPARAVVVASSLLVLDGETVEVRPVSLAAWDRRRAVYAVSEVDGRKIYRRLPIACVEPVVRA